MVVFKYCLFLTLLLVTIHGFAQYSAVAPEDSPTVHFEQGLSWADIMAKARQEGKYIFLDAYASWCGPCKLMDREVYPNDTVAAVINRNFVAVKAQIDTTARDAENIVRWYGDARDLRLAYKIEAYPTLLFFNPDGQLVYRQVGYNGVKAFVRTVKTALDPLSAEYFAELENYRTKGRYVVSDSLARYARLLGLDSVSRAIANEYIGTLSVNRLESPEKILFVLDFARNRRMADSLFLSYRNRLNQLSDAAFCSYENLDLSERFFKQMTSHDKFFHLCFEAPKKVDSLLHWSIAQALVDSTITREELVQKVAALSPGIDPDWKKLEAALAAKYPSAQAGRLVLDFELKYYKARNLWPAYTSILVRRVQTYGPFGFVDVRDFNLNNLAWEVFQHSQDTTELRIALGWSNEAVELVKEGRGKDNLGNWMDTNANLLYKLGDREHAVIEEKEAMLLDPKRGALKDALNKMLSGQPTW